MRFFKRVCGFFGAFFSSLLFNIVLFSAEASEETDIESAMEAVAEFAEEDKLVFGILPIWLFLLIIAGVIALAIIIIIEAAKRSHK